MFFWFSGLFFCLVWFCFFGGLIAYCFFFLFFFVLHCFYCVFLLHSGLLWKSDFIFVSSFLNHQYMRIQKCHFYAGKFLAAGVDEIFEEWRGSERGVQDEHTIPSSAHHRTNPRVGGSNPLGDTQTHSWSGSAVGGGLRRGVSGAPVETDRPRSTHPHCHYRPTHAIHGNWTGQSSVLAASFQVFALSPPPV